MLQRTNKMNMPCVSTSSDGAGNFSRYFSTVFHPHRWKNASARTTNTTDLYNSPVIRVNQHVNVFRFIKAVLMLHKIQLG